MRLNSRYKLKFIDLSSISTIRENFTSSFPLKRAFGKKTSEINVCYMHLIVETGIILIHDNAKN